MKRIVVLLVAVLLAVSVVPIASAQEDDAEVVLRVGYAGAVDNLNPTAGFLVGEYEIWNLHYATLTDKAIEDFATIPGLAESWEEVETGLAYTYTLRDGLTWSDGEPLTAEDVAWNINTSVEQSWANHISTTQNLVATAIDERTIEVISAVPDPKLPSLDVYLLPKHIWEPVALDGEAVATYDGLDGVGSGPFVIEEFLEDQSVTLVSNPSYWGWNGEEPPIDRVVFQLFTNADAMVASFQNGELDVVNDVPPGSVETLQNDSAVEVVVGAQGGFYELAINGGAAEGQPHPALLDIEVRRAIGHAIDEQAFIDDVWFGLVEPIETISPGADLKWVPEIPEDQQFNYDPDLANQILDDGGYLDTDGDGTREMPDGTNPIVLRHGVLTTDETAQPFADLFTGWMEAIGIGVTLEPQDSDQLFTTIIEGTYDTFFWDWVPFVDPDPMLSYFTAAELGNYNDANWTDPRYEELYLEQKEEVDPDRRIEIVHEMLTVFHDAAVYFPLLVEAEIQAYRVDRFAGWVRQPADTGPIIYSNTSPSYALLTPVGVEAEAESSNTWIIVGGIAAIVVIAGIFLAMRNRSSTSDERE
ncbi:MAG: ABC transporter substrate-binding protein [Actinomycetota bacterium]|nr:ABC transporter substrate-binding protein [Actinomycetota bacterium]